MIPSEHFQQFEHALNSKDPFRSLHELAVALRDEGASQVNLYALFSHFYEATPSDDPRYDAIADNMDLIWGGAIAKGHALFPTALTNEDVRSLPKEVRPRA